MLAGYPDFWELVIALKTGRNVVSMNKRVISQLPSMHTPTVQNKRKASLIHRTMNKQTLLTLSIRLKVADVTSNLLHMFFESESSEARFR